MDKAIYHKIAGIAMVLVWLSALVIRAIMLANPVDNAPGLTVSALRWYTIPDMVMSAILIVIGVLVFLRLSWAWKVAVAAIIIDKVVAEVVRFMYVIGQIDYNFWSVTIVPFIIPFFIILLLVFGRTGKANPATTASTPPAAPMPPAA